MRRYRAIGVAVFVLLLAAVGCHDHHPVTTTPVTITVIGAPNALAGASGHVGDTLEWTTLEPDGPGYTVMFPNGSPCPSVSGKTNSFHVDPGKSVKCPVTVAASSGTQAASFTYSITLDDVSLTPPPTDASATQSGKNGRPFNVIPCRLCVYNPPPDAVSARAVAAPVPPTDPTQISCDNGNVKVGDTSVTQDGKGKQYIWWSAPDDWSVTFAPKSPCTGNVSTFSHGGKATCTIDPKAVPNQYTYTATLAGCATPGPGTLTIK
jgi:hypothetical protein